MKNSWLYDYHSHTHATCERARKLLGPKYDSLFSFAVIREPYDWIYSLYRQSLRFYNSTSHHTPIWLTSFDLYVREMITLGDHKPCQSYFILSNHGDLLVNAIGLFNDIDCFVSRISDMLHLHLPTLPNLNANPVSSSEKTKPLLSEEMQALILENWHSDFTLWIYANTHRNELCLKSSDLFRVPPPSTDLADYDHWSYMPRRRGVSSGFFGWCRETRRPD